MSHSDTGKAPSTTSMNAAAVLATATFAVLTMLMLTSATLAIQIEQATATSLWSEPDLLTLDPETVRACRDYSDKSLEPPVRSYWPPGTFSDFDWSLRHGQSRQLCAMGESPLARPEPYDGKFRLTWLPSFSRPITIRVEPAGPKTPLTATVMAPSRDPQSGDRRSVDFFAGTSWHKHVPARLEKVG